ncbi:MAG: 2-octaprenyl-6-methoxyphenyl hydroxylase [Gammaproteobacteria bacterium]|nr:2-octaprenyl-6-methoxyphenyl hydroxylase [Gammaproteobacteria bacterium]
MSDKFDIVIIGGGLVGATLALALAPLKLKIAIVETQTEHQFQHSHLEVRSLALAYGGAQILRGLGLWEFIQPQVNPILNIHVSDRGHFGMTRLSADKTHVDALGYVIEIPVLLSVLYQQLALSSVKQFSPATLLQLDQASDQVTLLIETEGVKKSISAKLVLGADGGKSTVRQLLAIESHEHDYEQVAIVSNIRLKRPHLNQAYERFTADGPLALLPLSDNRMSIIWTVKQDRVAGFLAQSDAEFLSNLQLAFGYRAGRFEAIGARQTYPLKQLKVNSHYRSRVGLIGNSAHSLHPVAGQGFNLSMRDIAGLVSIIADKHYQGIDLDETVFERYVALREADHAIMLKVTDTLVKVFSTQSFIWSLPRNIALHKVERLSPIKHEINKLMMGVRGRLNRLARGLPLEQDCATYD